MTDVVLTYTDGTHSGGVARAKVHFGGGTHDFAVGGMSAADNALARPVEYALSGHLKGGGGSSGTVTISVAG